MIHTQTEEECADITGKSAKAISRTHYSSWSSSSGIDVSSTIVQEFMSFKTPAESCLPALFSTLLTDVSK